MQNKILVLAAHPDDEILGCGGTIKKYSQKNFICKTIFFSDGESSRVITDKNKVNRKIDQRKNQAKKAGKIIGSKHIDFLNFPDNKLYKIDFLKIVQIIEKNISEFKPNKIFTHYYDDLNIDHSIISKATITACRPAKYSFLKELIFYYEPSSTDWNFSSKEAFKANYYEDISKQFSHKYSAIKCYKNEIKKKHPRSLESIKSFSRYNGSIIGCDYAEPFIIAYSKK